MEQNERLLVLEGASINRGHTRYLFYYTFVRLLRAVLARNVQWHEIRTRNITEATLKLVGDQAGFNSLCETAGLVIDQYIPENNPDNAPYRNDPGLGEANTVKDFFPINACGTKPTLKRRHLSLLNCSSTG